MRHLFTKFALALAVVLLGGCSTREYDLCVYGGTSSGVVAAYSAAKSGLKVVLVEPTEHIGGMTSGGLGFTDIGNKQVIKGVAKQFYRKVGEHYGCLEQYIFEPSVADSIMRAYLEVEGLTVMSLHRLESVEKEGSRIRRIKLERSDKREKKTYLSARYFIDASYEGDLMAHSGVEYFVGREGNDRYGESLNGVQMMTGHQFPDGIDPYVEPGNPSSGLLWGISDGELAQTGSEDSMVQAYNYRICLTDVPENRIPIEKPEGYDPARYELLLRLMQAQPQKNSLNDYFIWSRMPNGKTDINNRGGFSSDMIGMNHSYPEASYEQRDSILAAHTAYTKGLLYFIGHDERVPEILRKKMLLWGYPKDEYVGNSHWTPQLYVRESRRMIGEYVATQADCQGLVCPYDGVAMAAYQMDSHNCQRLVVIKNGIPMVKNEGNVEVGGGLPYPISYRSLTPKRSDCTNLLVPVCLSASHIAYGSIRMEPVFMVLGQVSALAVAQAIQKANCDVQDVDSREINVAMDENPFMDGSQPDILIDDNDADVTMSGDWSRVEGRGGYGLSYCRAEAFSNGSLDFKATIPSDGTYALYTYQPVKGQFSSSLDVRISFNNKSYSISIPRKEISISGQTTTTWVPLGEYDFTKNDEVIVSVLADEADAPARADAVLFVKR